MKLTEVVPWGRSFDEYRKIFSLTDGDLAKHLLGCGDGPACFNAELTRAGGRVVSIDPIYQFSREQIRARIDDVWPQVLAELTRNKDDYIWESISSVEVLGQIRMDAMGKFLSDYDAGKASGRYLEASLPELPFTENSFDLALCSHYLFLYSDHVDQEEHLLSLKELCRVAHEVRVYPLLSLDGARSRHLMPVVAALRESGVDVAMEQVSYQFQKDATHMLVLRTL